MGPLNTPTTDKHTPSNRVSVCNPRPAWQRRTSSVSVLNGSQPPHYADATSPPTYHSSPSALPTSTTASLPGYRLTRTVGACHGTTTGALPKDGVKMWIKAACRMGAEVPNLTNLLCAMREVAMERLVADCLSKGGNALVGVSVSESEMMGCVTVTVTGTAVMVEPANGGLRDPFEGE